jgi:signal transduction histidine kinase
MTVKPKKTAKTAAKAAAKETARTVKAAGRPPRTPRAPATVAGRVATLRPQPEPRAREGAAAARLASTFAHHVRTPLATALLYLRLVENELGTRVDEDLRDGLAAAHDEIVRLEQLLSALIDHHRFGHLIIHPALEDAGQVVAEAVRRAVRDRIATGIGVDLGSGLVDWWDAPALDHIVHNLLANAVQHGSPPISVTVDRIDGLLRLRVKDGGKGLSARARERVFRRRLTVPKQRASSLGLGLWLVRELAEAHGGGARAESAPGGGTAFIVTLAPMQQRPPRD